MPKIKNIKDLRNDLLSKYEEAVTDDNKRDLGVFTASASAIIRSLKTEMDYNKYKDSNRDIDFLEVNSKKNETTN